jgi:hypothetical protein
MQTMSAAPTPKFSPNRDEQFSACKVRVKIYTVLKIQTAATAATCYKARKYWRFRVAGVARVAATLQEFESY